MELRSCHPAQLPRINCQGMRLNEIPLPILPCPAGIKPTTLLDADRSSPYRMIHPIPIPFYPISYDQKSPLNAQQGAFKRVAPQTPPIDYPLFHRFKAFVREWVQSNLDPLGVNDIMSFDEWVDGLSFNLERKRQLRAAAEEWNFSFPPFRIAARIASFIKLEFYLIFKYPRMINSRCDAFKAFSGRYFKSIERVVYDVQSPFGHPFFIKHVPVCDRPQMISKLAGPRFFGTDYSSFEASFVSDIIRNIEGTLYKHMLKNFPLVAKYIVRVISGTNRIRTRSGFNMDVLGRRMSGDMCTSLGNGFTNLMLMLFYAHEHGMVIDGFVEGDDGLFSSVGDIDGKWFTRLGFTLKIEESVTPGEASFCGCLNDGINIIKDPVKALISLCFAHGVKNLKPNSPRLAGIFACKALSALCELPRCPIVTEFALMMLRRVPGVTPIFVPDGYHASPDISRLDYNHHIPTSTRVLFHSVFNISVAMQLHIEAQLRKDDISHLGILFVNEQSALDQLRARLSFMKVSQAGG